MLDTSCISRGSPEKENQKDLFQGIDCLTQWWGLTSPKSIRQANRLETQAGFFFFLIYLFILGCTGYLLHVLSSSYGEWGLLRSCGAPASHSEKAMAPQSSTLAWKIPWAEEPGRLQSMGSLRVGHDWVTSLSLFTFMHWRRKWPRTPVFLPGESQGWGSLAGCCLWGHTESDTTEAT